MGNTAIEELIERETDCFCEQGYYFEYLKPNLVKAIISELQAKHDEEITNLESMVKEAINLPKGIEPHSFSDYKANH